MKTERENTKSYQQHDINHENKHFGIKKSSEKKKSKQILPPQKNVNNDCIWEGSDLFLFLCIF